jgi:anaerobic selenocysteine-containing dehydrogenase
VPRDNGHNVVEAIHAMAEGRAKVFIGLGGNFAQATPDSPRTFAALSNCDLTVQISTKLNRSHLAHGKDALILPCLGRTDIDLQTEGPQAGDRGRLVQHGPRLQRPVAAAVEPDALGAGDHRRHRRRHAGQQTGGLELAGGRLRAHPRPDRRHHPGFKDFNEKVKNPGGFYLGNSAGARKWNTRRAGPISAQPAAQDLVHERTRATGNCRT